MHACLHTRAGEPVCPGWGEGATVALTLHVPASQRVAECRGHVCPRVHTPRAGPCSSSRLLPPGAAADSGRRGGAGRPRPCSPERWPGQGGRPGPGQRAGGGRGGLWSAPRASCPASGRDFGRKVGLIRKALPGEVGLPEAESASPGVHANPLPLPPPGASSTAAVPRLAPEAGRVEREHPASACGLCPWAQTPAPQGQLVVPGPLDIPQHLPAEPLPGDPSRHAPPSSHCPKKWLKTPRRAGLA